VLASIADLGSGFHERTGKRPKAFGPPPQQLSRDFCGSGLSRVLVECT
jgi:hypothetical protein